MTKTRASSGRQNALDLPKFIEERTDIRFNLSAVDTRWGSGCVGAFAEKFFNFSPGAADEAINRSLDLSYKDARKIVYNPCCKEGKFLPYDEIDRKSAVAMLRRFAKTGKIYYTPKSQRVLA